MTEYWCRPLKVIRSGLSIGVLSIETICARSATIFGVTTNCDTEEKTAINKNNRGCITLGDCSVSRLLLLRTSHAMNQRGVKMSVPKLIRVRSRVTSVPVRWREGMTRKAAGAKKMLKKITAP